MSTGTAITRAFGRAFELELPVRRRSQGARFFAGLKPLHPTGYAGLLRALARTLVEADLVPVRKDARHDPVELIAAALEISIEQWDRGFAREEDSPSAAGPAFWLDIALRLAAFEALFRCRVHDERWSSALAAVAAELEAAAPRAGAIDSFDRARGEVWRVVGSSAAHLDAALAEIVVLGSASASVRFVSTTAESDRAVLGRSESIDSRARALRLADGMVLVVERRLPEALAVFEAIVERVPGHTLALEQAARCCAILGDSSKARLYSKRASRLGRTLYTSPRCR